MRYCLVCIRLSIEAHALAISTKNVPAIRAEMTLTTKAAATFFSIRHRGPTEPGQMKNDQLKRCEEGNKINTKNQTVNISICRKYVVSVSTDSGVYFYSYVACGTPFTLHDCMNVGQNDDMPKAIFFLLFLLVYADRTITVSFFSPSFEKKFDRWILAKIWINFLLS